MIQFRQLSLYRGVKCLFEDVNLQIAPGHKVGVVGKNGCGKSSLFSLLMDKLPVDQGDCLKPKGWRIGWVKQETPALESSALDYVLDGDSEFRQTEAEIKQAEEQHQGEKIASLHQKMDAIGGYQAKARAGTLLHGLGFTTAQLDHPVKAFSGGWRMRLNLAQALMCRADLLLLDEPTNHLDLDAVLWLEAWLQRFDGTLLLISHDREFLDNCVGETLAIENQRVELYQGGYSAYERQRAEKLAQQQAMYDKQQRQAAHLQKFVDRFKAKASKAKQAQSRVKMLERLELAAPAHVDSPFQFSILEPDQIPANLLSLSQVSLGYGDTRLINNINLSIHAGDRIGLLGKNGAGKSTLIKALSDQLPLLDGDKTPAKHLKIGYFAQHQLEQLTKGSSPLQHLQRLDRQASEQHLRDYLGGFNFRGDHALDPIDHFSGGEKARLSLALMLYHKPNMLLLDEPTNHLDLDMRLALELALQTFDGAVIMVSHDRHMLMSCCDKFLLVDAGVVSPFDDDLEGYAQWLKQQASNKSTKTNSGAKDDRKEQKRREAEFRKRVAPLKKQIQKLESQLDKWQETLSVAETSLSDTELYLDENKTKLQQTLASQAEAKQQIEQLEMEWMSCEEELQSHQQEFEDAS